MKYASLDDFEGIIKRLMHDPAIEPLNMTLGEQTATLSLLLRVYILPDIPPREQALILQLCDKYSAAIIARYPFAAGYVDFLYGAAAIGRGLN